MMNCPTLKELPAPPAGKTGWPWTEETKLFPAKMPNGESWPLISIVTPSYNQGEFIEETIRSLLLQGYPNLEYLIMDGGSTDNSVDIIKKYEPWLTDWVSEPDRGQTHAINKGFARVSGTILAWLNSDDTYDQGALQAIANLMVRKPDVDVVYGNATVVDEHGQAIAELRSVPFDPQAFFYETVHIAAQSAVFWRRELFAAIGELNEALRYSMDRELLLRFVQKQAKFEFLRQTLGTYRCHSSSKTFGTGDESREELLKLDEFAKIRSRSDYSFWKTVYRLRQFAWLGIQGDFPYMMSRALSRFRPSQF